MDYNPGMSGFDPSGPMTVEEAVRLLDAGRLDEAIAALNRAMRAGSESYLVHLHLAVAYHRKAAAGDGSMLRAAERSLGEAIRLAGSEPATHGTLIEIGNRMGLGRLLLSQYREKGGHLPFIAEITAQNMAAFLVHPDASPTGRESAPVTLNDVTLSYDGPNIVRLSGLASNPNPFAVKNVIVSGVLLDGREQIVQAGAAYVLQADIGAGESVRFDVRIRREDFATYKLYAQAERDWK